MSDVQERIREIVKNNRIVLFMKGTPEQPLCGYSANTSRMLGSLGASYVSVDVIGEPEYRDGVKVFSNWPTLPQLYIDGQLIGGFDIAYEMYQKGELQKLVAGESAPG